MNKLEIFQNESFGEIRTTQIDNEIWFVGKDVASALGYSDTNKAIAMHIDEEDKLNDKTSSSLGQRGGWLINESGLYSLILSSKLPTAKEFKRWVTNEILPSIRKTGKYEVPTTVTGFLELSVQAIKELEIKVDNVKKEVKEEVREEVSQKIEDFKQDMPLLALEIEYITKARNKTAVALLGGKESPAYQNKSLRGKVYSDLSREIKRQFGVDTYKAIKRCDCQAVIKVIDNYKLPICLENEITAENDQMCMVI